MAGIGHRGFMGRKKGRDCSSYLPGLYTVDEINQMVFVDGYIPVASIDDLSNCKNTVSQTMGSGTCWEGIYTTGVDKKYIQVDTIDGSGFGTYLPIGSASSQFSGIYDGNMLPCLNISQVATTSPSGVCGHTIYPCEMRNIIVDNADIRTTLTVASFVGGIASLAVGSVIDNCIVRNSSIGKEAGSVGAYVGGIVGGSDGTTITRCNSESNTLYSSIATTGSTNGKGGIVGYNNGASIIRLCLVSSLSFNERSRYSGGICGVNSTDSIVEKSAIISTTTLLCEGYAGGIIGQNFGKVKECFNGIGTMDCNSARVGGVVGSHINNSTSSIIDCYSYADITSSSNNVGGVVGICLSGSDSIISNCYSTGSITGGLNIGGAFGVVQSGVTISAVYWDTVASGNATSADGTGKTTAELQTPTSNTGIYANYDPAIWDFGTSSEYPKLTTIP